MRKRAKVEEWVVIDGRRLTRAQFEERRRELVRQTVAAEERVERTFGEATPEQWDLLVVGWSEGRRFTAIEWAEAYRSGVWKAFSEARGYTAEEIAQLEEWVRFEMPPGAVGPDDVWLDADRIFDLHRALSELSDDEA